LSSGVAAGMLVSAGGTLGHSIGGVDEETGISTTGRAPKLNFCPSWKIAQTKTL